MHVAIRVEESRSRPLNVLVESLVSQASRPLHIWLLDGTAEGIDLDEVALRAGGSTITAIPTKGLGVDLRGLSTAARNRSRSGFDMLMLPALLPDLDRVVLLPLERWSKAMSQRWPTSIWRVRRWPHRTLPATPRRAASA